MYYESGIIYWCNERKEKKMVKTVKIRLLGPRASAEYISAKMNAALNPGNRMTYSLDEKGNPAPMQDILKKIEPPPILPNKRKKPREEKRSTQSEPPSIAHEPSSSSIATESTRVEPKALGPQNPPYNRKL